MESVKTKTMQTGKPLYLGNLGDVVEFVDLWELPGHPLVFEFSKGGNDSKAI